MCKCKHKQKLLSICYVLDNIVGKNKKLMKMENRNECWGVDECVGGELVNHSN